MSNGHRTRMIDVTWSRSSLRCDDGSPIVDNTYDLPVAHERRQVMSWMRHHLVVFIHIKGKGLSCTGHPWHHRLSPLGRKRKVTREFRRRFSPSAGEEWLSEDGCVTVAAGGTKSRQTSGSNTPLSLGRHIAVGDTTGMLCTLDSERSTYMLVTYDGAMDTQQRPQEYTTCPCFVGSELVAKNCHLSSKRNPFTRNIRFSRHHFTSITRRRGPNAMSKRCNRQSSSLW